MASFEKLKEELEDLRRQYQEITGEPAALFDIKNIQDVNRAIKILNESIDSAREKAARLEGGFAGIYSELNAIIGELKKSNQPLNLATKALSKIQGIAQKLKIDEADIVKLNKKQLESLSSNLEIQKDELIAQAEKLKGEKDLSKYTPEELEKRDAILKGLRAEFKAIQDTNDLLDKRIKKEERIEELMGLAGATIKGIRDTLNKIGLGGLADKLGVEKAEEEMRKTAEGIDKGTINAGKLGGKFTVLAAGIKSMGKSFIKNLKDPLSFIIFMVKNLKEAFMSADKATGDLAKNMNITFTEASKVRGELTAFAAASLDTFLNTRALQESLMSINQSLGTSVMFADQDVAAFTKLREQAGLTNEQIMGTYKLSLLNGKLLEDNTSEFLAQAKITGFNNKVLLNDKELLKDISKTSAATQLSLSGSAKALGEALATAKSLGMTMDQIESSSEALLNFESSITNELKAELLLGKNINLERARLAALNNEFSVVAEEISNQIGDSADFSKMNRIQQEAIAQSVGMTRNSLAQTLMEREALVGLSGKEQELGQETLRGLIARYGVEGAQRRLEEDGIDNLMNQTSRQEDFNAAVEKFKEIFIAMEPAVSSIFGLINGMLTAVNFILSPLTMILGTMKNMGPIAGTITSLLTAAAIAALFFSSSLTLGVGALAALSIAGIGAMIIKQSTTPVADMYYDPSRGPMISNIPGGIYEGRPGEGAGIFPANTAANNSSAMAEQREIERADRRREERARREHENRVEALLTEQVAESRESNRGYLYSA
jgi:myosin heavy subunit